MEIMGEIAIVTGGGAGIGESVSLKLAKQGAVVGIADVNLDSARRVADAIIGEGGKAFAIKTDVCTSTEVKRMVQEVVDRCARVDILVNNVGVSPKNRDGQRLATWSISDEEWDYTIKVNLTSAFYCVREVIPHMINQGGGRIVLISSGTGKRGTGRTVAMAAYGAAKAGVINLTFTLAQELVSYNIRVNSVCPGLVGGTLMSAGVPPEIYEKSIEQIPMKRLGKPEEIAEAVYFLASPASSYITGEILDCNGGTLMD